MANDANPSTSPTRHPHPRQASAVTTCEFGRQICGDLDAASQREWLVTDGVGGYAMGTVSGLRTRRYHGLLIVAGDKLGRRHLGLAALDVTLVIGDRRVPLATHEWSDGAISPAGYRDLASFALVDGVPRWRWAVGDVIIEMEVATSRQRPGVGVTYHLLRAPHSVHVEIAALCTWRDVHGERFAGPGPHINQTVDGFVFEGHYRVEGPNYEPDGGWYRDVHYRQEANRGLNAREDLWLAGRFSAALQPGDRIGVRAWADDLGNVPPDVDEMLTNTRDRARSMARLCEPNDPIDEALARACDQFIVVPPSLGHPAVVAGYPWFGDWSRDTMTSYEGLFLETHRSAEGRQLLIGAAASLSEGMLANTADTGVLEYNTVDATLWFVHALGRHVAVTGDLDLAAELAKPLDQIVDHHLSRTRYGIRMDPNDGLLTQGSPGMALTWMDARIDGTAVTPRMGKAVEVNALWINALATISNLARLTGRGPIRASQIEATARRSFERRFVQADGQLADVVDGPSGDDLTRRPNQLLAASLPHGPYLNRSVVQSCGSLLTSLGLRSLSANDPSYQSHHRGGPVDRDLAYHQGTVWPWLLGPYAEAALRVGITVAGVLEGVEPHLSEFGLGSISETADGEPPHLATGCPFQAWSVAEIFRARRLVQRLS